MIQYNKIYTLITFFERCQLCFLKNNHINIDILAMQYIFFYFLNEQIFINLV